MFLRQMKSGDYGDNYSLLESRIEEHIDEQNRDLLQVLLFSKLFTTSLIIGS